MAKNSLEWMKSIIPIVVLSAGIVASYVRSEGKIETLQEEYVRMLKVDSVQTETIDDNENDIIGMKRDIAQIIKTQERQIEKSENDKNAIIEAIGRINGN